MTRMGKLFSNADPRRHGHEPDYRFTLANERTFLAWIRTSLGLMAVGLAVAQLPRSSQVDTSWGPFSSRWEPS